MVVYLRNLCQYRAVVAFYLPSAEPSLPAGCIDVDKPPSRYFFSLKIVKSIKFPNQYYLEMFFLGFELLTAAFKQNNASFQTINSGRVSRNRTIICEGCKVYRIGSITTN